MVQIDPFLRDPDLFLSRGIELDSNMLLKNRPNAVTIGGGPSYDQWYLGLEEHRSAKPGEATKKLVLLSIRVSLGRDCIHRCGFKEVRPRKGPINLS
jgi:hypothetical protein